MARQRRDRNRPSGNSSGRNRRSARTYGSKTHVAVHPAITRPGRSGRTTANAAYADELNHAKTESPATRRIGPIGLPGRRKVTRAPTVGSGTYTRYTAAMSH